MKCKRGAPSGMRSRSSKRVMPSNATFSITMLMSGKPRSWDAQADASLGCALAMDNGRRFIKDMATLG